MQIRSPLVSSSFVSNPLHSIMFTLVLRNCLSLITNFVLGTTMYLYLSFILVSPVRVDTLRKHFAFKETEA